jgi:hypothetical protein
MKKWRLSVPGQTSLRIRSAVSARIAPLAWIGLAAAGILSNPACSYPGRDAGIFLYIGSLILKGRIPYLEVWENKGPLVFYINALGLALSGGSRWGVWFLEFLFLFGAAVIGYIVLRQLMGTIPALGGAFVWMGVAGNTLQGGNYSEEYSLLFSMIAVCFFLKSLEQPRVGFYSLLIGFSLGLNILLRPNNVSMQAAAAGAYFILALVSREWLIFFKRAVWMGAGAAIAVVPVIVYFASRGALAEMINVVLVFNYQYSSGIDLPRVLASMKGAAFSIGMVYAAAAILGYGFSLAFILKKGLHALPAKFLLILLLGWPIEAVLSALSGRDYLHYFIGWTPYAGLLCGYLIYILLQKFDPVPDAYSSLVLIILIAVTLFGNMNVWRDYGAVLSRLWSSPNDGFDYRDPVALYIMENTAPGEKVFIWGFRPVINFVSGRESPVAFLPYPLIHVKTPLGYRWADQFYSQLTADPPVLIINMIETTERNRIPDLDTLVRKQNKIKYKDVVLARNLPDTFDFIKRNYIRVETIGGYDIYRLKTINP